MSENISEIINDIINLLFCCLYVSIVIKIYRYSKNKYQGDELTNTINEIKNEQNKLLQIMVKLRNIIKVDDKLTNEQTYQIKKIKKEVRKINYLLDINHKTNNSENENENSDLTDYEYQNSIKSEQNNDTPIFLHKQNHITFPNYFVFNEINLKKTKLLNNNHKLQIIGDDIRLVSNELSRFLKIEIGTCIEFNDVFKMVYNYIQENNIVNLSQDINLCKLFGINENGDYEFKDAMLIKILTQLLEPHFRNIIDN